MVRKTLAIFVVALAIPAAAMAAKPSHPSTPTQSKAAPKVMYVLNGTLWNYTAASSTANGAITIHVTHSNYHSRALVGQDITFAITAKTTTTLNNNTTISNGARGIVKFKAPLKVSNTTLLATLAPSQMTARAVIGKG